MAVGREGTGEVEQENDYFDLYSFIGHKVLFSHVSHVPPTQQVNQTFRRARREKGGSGGQMDLLGG
jgi:hypothetical protein